MTNLEQIAREIRILTVKCIASLGSGHIGGSMSIVDVLTALYYKEMNVDPKNPLMEGRDRLVVSKGHAGPAVYATLAHKGYFPESELYTLNKYGTNLPSHCDMNKTPGVDMTTGFTQLFDIFFLGKERHILYRAAILDTAPALLPK